MKNSHLSQRIRRRLRNQRIGRRLQLEALESRQVLSNIPVTTFADVVNPIDNVTSLREAIAQADANSEADTIAVPAGTYQLNSGLGELAIDDSYAVTIQSTGGPATIDAIGLGRVFSVAAGSNVTLEGLVITGGAATKPGKDVGGGLHNLGEIAISDCVFRFNSATLAGGALQNSGSATVTNTVFEWNSSVHGGAVDNTGTLTVTGGAYHNNKASFIGGGINSPNYLSVNGTTFTGNSAEWGGAILNGGYATIENSWLHNNSAVGGGGIRNDAAIEVTNSTLSGNSAKYGAGISSGFGGTTKLTGSTISGNIAYDTGGGIELWSGTMHITTSTVSDNSAYRAGGIYSAGTLSIDTSTVLSNSAAFNGGGLFNDYYAPLNITASTFEGNTAGSAGGGIYSEYGYGQFLAGNSFLANTASNGAGLYLYGYAPTITNNHISSNVNGGLVLNTDNAYITNNIIADNIGNGLSIEYGYNTIGTVYPGGGNTITGNSGAGVAVNGYSNSIRGNVIHTNGGLAIDLGGDGRTSNDPYDGDYGANSLQNHPVLTYLETGATTHVTGRLNSTPYSSFTVDFYAQTGNAPVNPGSAIRYLGSVDVVTDENGFAAIDVLLNAPTSADELVSATATSLYGDTSEMSDFDLIPVSPVSGLVTSEGGINTSFSVVLAVPPTANVSIPLASTDASEGTVSPAVLTFTPENWNVPQFASVAGVEDDLKDGVINYQIILGPVASADSRFDEFEPAEVQVKNYDNDFATPESIKPRGSLVYQSTLEGAVTSAGWTESYSLLLDPGQTLSVLVETSEALRARVAVYDAKGVLVGSATAATTGGDALVQTIRIPGQIAGNGGVPSMYRVVVGAADGTTGTFTVTTFLNAALEIESHGGVANDLMNSAQDLENSFISLLNANNGGNVPLPQRGAVLGEISADSLDSADWYRFDLKAGQNMSATLNVLRGSDAQLSLISANGTILAIGSSDRADNFDQVISTFVAQSTGMYYLKVGSEFGASYSLVVTRNAGLDIELNGSKATAQDLLVPEVGGRRLVMGAIQPNVITFDALDSGSYDERGNTNPWDTDYYTGYTPLWYPDPNAIGEHRSYFVFDLSELEEEHEVLGAQFNVYAADRYSSKAYETLQLSEVTTPVNALVAGTPGSVDIFDDLGDGTVFGVRDMWYTEMFQNISIDLNEDAVAAVTTAKGQQFALGGALTSIDYDDWYEIIFAYAGSAANKRQLALTVTDKDFYKIAANGNKVIEIETSTPAGNAGEFVNTLDPVIRLYNSAGQLVGTNDNGAGDGRNAQLSYKVPKNGGGDYYIEVVAAESTGEEATGEYILSVKGANAPQDEFVITAASPVDGATVLTPPTQIVVDGSDNILLPTLQAADMQIDGLPTEAVTVVDGDTAAFEVKYAHEYKDHFYILTSSPMDWIQAETEAQALGGHLVTINDQLENDFLHRVYFSGAERETGYWTGMNDMASEGTWVWVSGEPVTYTNWLFGTPDDYWWNEDFGEINGYASNGVWNDTNVNNYGTPFAGIIELTTLPAGYRVATEGVHAVSIAAGAIKDTQGTPNESFTSTFVLDYTAPRVVSSTIESGATLPDGRQDLTLTIGFSETMDASTVDISDVTLIGKFSRDVCNPSSVSFNETGTELTIRFEDIDLVEDQYSLTLASRAYSFQDVVGLYLDGESTGALPSGNGLEGGDFVLDILVDAPTRPVPQPWIPVDPLGSFIYRTPYVASGLISPDGDTDDWTVELDPGQTFSVVLDPSSQLVGAVSIIGPDSIPLETATGSVAGSQVLLQAVPVTAKGTYTIRVGGSGGSTGAYSFDAYLNSAVEEETLGGPTNDDTASAQPIDPSVILLPGGVQRAAVLGETARLSGTIAEVESNDDFWSAQDIDGGSWNVDFDPYIDESTVRPHISIQGTGDNSYDYYSFTVSTAGEYGIFDIDLTSGLDSWLDIFDGFGNILYTSDDAGYDNGSFTGFDSLISYEFPSAGTYYVRVASCCDQPVQLGSAYTLQISLANHPVNPPSGSADTYSVSLDADQAVTIVGTSLTGGDIDISLLDNDGNVVASGTDDDLAEVIDFSVGSSGTYYIQVTGDSAVEYSLVVTQSEIPGEGEAPHLADGASSSAVTEFVWCNASESHDVNGDGRVSPLDALAIINSLNAEGTRQLPSDSVGQTARLFYDVNRDGFISPRDALQVVNYLNAGENSRTVAVTTPQTVSTATGYEEAMKTPRRVTESDASLATKIKRPDSMFDFVAPPSVLSRHFSTGVETTDENSVSVDFWSDPDLRWTPDEHQSKLDVFPQEAMSQATVIRRELELQYRERIFEAYGRQRVGSGL